MTTAHQSPPLFPTLPVELGAYTLTHLLGSHGTSDYYIARQNHVERHVVLEVMRPTGEQGDEALAAFLAQARARSAMKLPHVAGVLESTTTPEGYTCICQALPEGTPLSELAAAGKQLTPQQICTLINSAGKVCEACAAAGNAAAPFTADMIFLNRAGGFNFLSPVLASPPVEGEQARQLQALSAVLRAVQPLNVPGQGRIATLLSWMQDGYEGDALDWAAISDTAALIARQLQPESILHLDTPKRYDRGRELRAGKRRRQQRQRRAAFIGLAALTILAMGAAGTLLAPDTVPPIPALRGGYVHVKAGDKTMRVTARPVSIAEYRQFLDDWGTMDAPRRGSLTQNIPPTESDPTPADWATQLSTPQANAPVTNVSYWQALMYARYQRASLPSATLLAAARAEAGSPGLEEWTQDEHPASAPYCKFRLVLPAETAASPIPEDNPATHSPQRSFRICR